MPDALAQALAMPGLGALLLTTLVAGIVYGFAGFGAAMIFMPVAAVYVPLAIAVAAFNLSALTSFVTVLPRAWAQVNRRALIALILPAIAAAWAGLWVLRVADLTWLRWAVCAVCAVTLLALVSGWRMQAAPGAGRRAGIGAATGFVGGATGLLGPVMVLFQLAGQDSAAVSRATAVVFLTITSTALLPLMAVQGLLTGPAVALGILLMLPYAAGAKLGQALFQPSRERYYRVAAYLIIGCAIFLGLPIWD